jgi:hypothetical protein
VWRLSPSVSGDHMEVDQMLQACGDSLGSTTSRDDVCLTSRISFGWILVDSFPELRSATAVCSFLDLAFAEI